VGALTVPNGTTRFTETVPTSAAGTWVLDHADCDGTPLSVSGLTATLTIAHPVGSHLAALCTLVNRWVPAARLTTDLTTLGGTGSAVFVITPLDTSGGGGVGPALVQTAATTASGVAATAAGDDTTALDVGTYTVTPSALVDPPGGHWVFDSAVCAGGAASSGPLGADHAMEVTLADGTATDAAADCHFVYSLRADPTVDLVKQVSAGEDLREGPVILTLSCPQGERASLVLATGQTSARLAVPVPVEAPQTCQVAETATGAGAGVAVSATYTITDAAGEVTAAGPLTGAVAVPVGTTAQVVSVADAYSATGSLPKTGGGGLGVAVGLALLSAGSVALLAARRRRSA
jgi:LPXTG-motif cell wall-anchored protein